MTDLVQGREEYKGLTISDRVLILDAAIDAVIKNANAGIGVHFEKAEFERKAPALWSEVFGSIYTVACGMCLQITGDWLTRWHNHMGVLYVFEKGHKFRAQADEFLTTFGQDEEFRKQTHYRNHIFELKGEPGLQAGDLLAWTVTRVTSVVDQKTIPPGLKPFAPSIRRFTNSMGDKYKVAQFAGANLDLFFEEIRHRQFKIFQRRGNYPKGLR